MGRGRQGRRALPARRDRRPHRARARSAALGAQVKPAPFEYVAPDTLDEALFLLDEESRPLAGGQSLVPLLNFRLARPERLVDLNRIEELSYLRRRDGV